MKNIDYVIKKYSDIENGNKELIIEYRCPSMFGLKELDCDQYECEDCWDLEVTEQYPK